MPSTETRPGAEMDAQVVIKALDLAPHPEGGWYRETYRAPSEGGARSAATAILFLLEAHKGSHWHRVDAVEMWLHHSGAPLELAISDETGSRRLVLGPEILSGQSLQGVVPAGAWQAARTLGAWSLVSCVVAPAFRFEGFELAPEGWAPSGASAGRV